MGESLYGKFGVSIVKAGVITLAIMFFVSIMSGFFLPESTVNLFFILPFLVLTVGIVLGIVGIVKDDLRENAIRALIAGILFLIVGIALFILYDMYISALLGLN